MPFVIVPCPIVPGLCQLDIIQQIHDANSFLQFLIRKISPQEQIPATMIITSVLDKGYFVKGEGVTQG